MGGQSPYVACIHTALAAEFSYPHGRPVAPMVLLAIGVNHKTAPVEIREKVSFALDRVPDALTELTQQQGVSEAVILSTCNRTEIYCGLADQDGQRVIEWFIHYHDLESSQIVPYLYTYPDQRAVEHVLQVASGLDSMILGEPQILGQLKSAYQTAAQTGTIGKLLGRLFQHTFAVAKQIRTDTAIGASPVSIAFATVRLAKQIFGDLSEKTALLIGAGKTIELTSRHLHENGLGRMIIANRNLERAQGIAAEFSGYAITLGNMPKHVAEADIIISSTASQLPILGKGMAESAVKLRKHRPIFMVDIAVPRDIEPEVGELEDVYLYTVDDLKGVIEQNLQTRQQAALQAEEIIATEVLRFMTWLQSLDAVSTIRALRENAETLRQEALAKAQRKLAQGVAPDKVIQELAHTLTNKLIHTPSIQLRSAATEKRHDLLEAAQELFDLKNGRRR